MVAVCYERNDVRSDVWAKAYKGLDMSAESRVLVSGAQLKHLNVPAEERDMFLCLNFIHLHPQLSPSHVHNPTLK